MPRSLGFSSPVGTPDPRARAPALAGCRDRSAVLIAATCGGVAGNEVWRTFEQCPHVAYFDRLSWPAVSARCWLRPIGPASPNTACRMSMRLELVLQPRTLSPQRHHPLQPRWAHQSSSSCSQMCIAFVVEVELCCCVTYRMSYVYGMMRYVLLSVVCDFPA